MTALSAATTKERAGAASRDTIDWHAIDWRRVTQNVRRLQVRIVKATQEGQWGKVHALQHLLTHSFSGKALAVKRVTENQGKKTPGVDHITLDPVNEVYSDPNSHVFRTQRPATDAIEQCITVRAKADRAK